MSAIFSSALAHSATSAPTTRSRGCASRRIRSRPSRACSAACCSTTAPGTASATCSTDSDFYRYEHRLIYARDRRADQRDQAGRRDHRLRAAAEPRQGRGVRRPGLPQRAGAERAERGQHPPLRRDRARALGAAQAGRAPATRSPPAPSIRRAAPVDADPRRGRRQDLPASARKARASRQGFQSMDTLVVQLIDRVNELHENGAEDVTGVRTGFYDLDRITSGLQAGRPDRAGGAAVDGQDRARAQHRRARRASTKACRWSCSRWKWAPRSSRCAWSARSAASTRATCAPARCATTNGARLSEAVEKLGKVSLFIDESRRAHARASCAPARAARRASAASSA